MERGSEVFPSFLVCSYSSSSSSPLCLLGLCHDPFPDQVDRAAHSEEESSINFVLMSIQWVKLAGNAEKGVNDFGGRLFLNMKSEHLFRFLIVESRRNNRI